MSARSPRTGLLVRLLAAVGAASLLLAAWLALGLPIGIDRLVLEQDEPMKADAIVCLGGGIWDHDLPVEPGWKRIYTSVQLWADGYAPIIVFTGGGRDRVSEAEVYAEAARWLGADPAALRLETASASTKDHPGFLLTLEGHPIRRDSRLIIVTSEMHTRRAAMCFRKAGYTNFRMVSEYIASKRDPKLVREARGSVDPVFTPNGKSYSGLQRNLESGLEELVDALRELAAITYYKVRGYV